MTSRESRRRVASAEQLFGLDVRSLACLRIGSALVLLFDLVSRSFWMTAHYTDDGILPRQAVHEWIPLGANFSVHMVSGNAWFEGLLFVLAGAAAVALLLGYRTRLMSVLSWYLLCSLQIRNPTILHGGDNFLRIFLFWSMFVPLGACWSLDRMRGRGPGRGVRVLSVGTFALILQLCLVYWVSALLKRTPAWTDDYTAVDMAVNLDYLATSVAVMLQSQPGLTRILTAATFWIEVLGPLLLFVPIFNAWTRTAAVFLFVGFHLVGIRMLFEIGLFPWICAVGWLMLLPTAFWDDLSRRRPMFAIEAGDRPTDSGRPLARRLGAVALAVVVVYGVLLNLRTLYPERFQSIPPPQLDRLVYFIGLHQFWSMFAPTPPRKDGWWIASARLADGRIWELWSDEPTTFDKPRLLSERYRNSRWIRYFSNLMKVSYVTLRPHYPLYLCRSWNRAHSGSERALSIDLLFVLEIYGEPSADPQVLPFGTFPCSAPPEAP